MWVDFARLAFSSLRRRFLRTSLTLVGIVIGMAAVVALVALGRGLDHAITEQFEKVGSDKLFIQPRGTFTGVGLGDAANVTEDDLKAVRKVEGVVQAAGHIAVGALAGLKDENVPVVIGSLPDDETASLVIEAHTYEIAQGRWMRNKERDAVVIGDEFTREDVLARKLVLGDKVRVDGRPFEVVGILEHVGEPDADSAMVLSEDALRDVANLSDDLFSVIVVRMGAGVDASVVQARVEHALRREHDVDEGKEDFDVQSPDDLLEVFNTILAIVQVVVVGIAMIALVVGGIGIANTMFTSVLERTREIGVMKAVGATRRDIFTLFVLESGLLGITGGVIGVSLGAGFAKLIEFVAFQAYGSPLLRADVPFWLVAGTLVFTFVAGVVSGVTPAMHAAKMPPVDALRGR